MAWPIIIFHIVREIMEVVGEQKEKLAKEVKKYCEERGV